jgi:glutathione S-transferase
MVDSGKNSKLLPRPYSLFPVPFLNTTMLKLYHMPLSANSSRVWIALIEKQLDYELVEMKLDGDQLDSEFTKISPFHHIPVLVDDNFNVIESLAILDYLEAKYPTPPLLPTDPKSLAIVRMVEMVTVNEFMPTISPLFSKMMGFSNSDDSQKIELAKQKVAIVIQFLEKLLDNSSYFGGEQLTLADIVAGSAIPFLPMLGISLDSYPIIGSWCDRLMARPSWQATRPTPEAIEASKFRIQALMARHQSRV